MVGQCTIEEVKFSHLEDDRKDLEVVSPTTIAVPSTSNSGGVPGSLEQPVKKFLSERFRLVLILFIVMFVGISIIKCCISFYLF